MMNDFPKDLLIKYKLATNKLKKFQRVVFKRFGPNVSDVSDEFNQLGLTLQNSYLPQYAALCWTNASQCEQLLGNDLTEIDYILKAARSYVAANREIDNLQLKSNLGEHLQSALNCYNHALQKLSNDAVMKAAVIREMKKIQPNFDKTGHFESPAHRIYDLEQSASVDISTDDYSSALDKFTEIYDDITERKVENMYSDVLRRIERSIILLILILRLPPARQSPSHVKLITKYADSKDIRLSDVQNYLKDLLFEFQRNDIRRNPVLYELSDCGTLNKDQQYLVAMLMKN